MDDDGLDCELRELIGSFTRASSGGAEDDEVTEDFGLSLILRGGDPHNVLVREVANQPVLPQEIAGAVETYARVDKDPTSP